MHKNKYDKYRKYLQKALSIGLSFSLIFLSSCFRNSRDSNFENENIISNPSYNGLNEEKDATQLDERSEYTFKEKQSKIIKDKNTIILRLDNETSYSSSKNSNKNTESVPSEAKKSQVVQPEQNLNNYTKDKEQKDSSVIQTEKNSSSEKVKQETKETKVTTASSEVTSKPSSKPTTKPTEPIKPTETTEPTKPTTGTEKEKQEFTVSLTISFQSLIENPDLLPRQKQMHLVPPGGYLGKDVKIEVKEGETALDLLMFYLDKYHIHYEIVDYSYGGYVRGINNIYEFNAGAKSGWMYEVNGKQSNKGAGRYVLEPGDEVIWFYTVGDE